MARIIKLRYYIWHQLNFPFCLLFSTFFSQVAEHKCEKYWCRVLRQDDCYVEFHVPIKENYRLAFLESEKQKKKETFSIYICLVFCVKENFRDDDEIKMKNTLSPPFLHLVTDSFPFSSISRFLQYTFTSRYKSLVRECTKHAIIYFGWCQK